MKREQYTVIDLFAGADGLSLGLYQSGWHGLFAIEKMLLLILKEFKVLCLIKLCKARWFYRQN